MAEASNPLMSAIGSIVPFAMHVEDNSNHSASTAGDCCACPPSDLEHLERDLVVEICQSSSCSMCEPIGRHAGSARSPIPLS